MSCDQCSQSHNKNSRKKTTVSTKKYNYLKILYKKLKKDTDFATINGFILKNRSDQD